MKKSLKDKPPDFIFDINPGLEVRTAKLTEYAIPVEESVFSIGQKGIIDKRLNKELSDQKEMYEAEIKKMKEEFAIKLDKEKKTAWQNGNQAGITLTTNQMLDSVNVLTEQLNVLLENMRLQPDAFVEYHESIIIELIVKMVRKVIDVEIQLNPEIILSVLKNSLNLLNEKVDIKVIVNPNDWAVVRENIDNLNLAIELPKNYEIVANEKIDQGGCRVDFKAGSIDAEIETQFAEVVRNILNV